MGYLKIPLYDIGTIAAGFYIGYYEGKGIDINTNIEHITKYGPTVFAVVTTLIIIKIMNSFAKWMYRKTYSELENGSLLVTSKSGYRKRYKDLSYDEQKNVRAKVITRINNLESKVENPKYLRPTLVAGTRTAIETAAGYFAGRLYSQLIT